MTILITLWLLFVVPILCIALVLLGAHIFHRGAQGQAPVAQFMPRFSFGTRKNGTPERDHADSLPEV